MSVSIVIGMGEVGRAVSQVLSTAHKVVSYDTSRDNLIPSIERDEDTLVVLHICIPFDEVFYASVNSYKHLFKPSYTVIHSTTPIGTCKTLECHHSPIRGIHPHLAESITTFTTYLAPKSTELKQYLEQAGMDVVCVSDTDTTEAGKLWSLTAYALSIILEKEMYQWCEANEVDYDICYKHFTHSYDNGYDAMGMGNYVRPVLEHMDGGIGGHCIIPGVEKLGRKSSKLANMILQLNEGYV